MRRILLIAFSVLVVAGLTASAALASNAHFKKGSPTCTIGGTASAPTVTCTASMSGLGNEDLTIFVSATGSASYICVNNGGQTAPGQSQVSTSGASSTPVSSDQIKNGTLTVTANPVTLTAPATVSGTTAGCPNSKSSQWTGELQSIALTSITLTVEQPLGTCVLKATASDPLTGTVTLTPVSC
jgi:hypothetical protein